MKVQLYSRSRWRLWIAKALLYLFGYDRGISMIGRRRWIVQIQVLGDDRAVWLR